MAPLPDWTARPRFRPLPMRSLPANHAKLRALFYAVHEPVEDVMQDDPNRRGGRRRETIDGAASPPVETAPTLGESIRQAFLTHMTEQQRQYLGSGMTGRRSPGQAIGEPRRR